MEWIGLIVVILFAVAMIGAGALIACLTGIGGAPKLSDIVQGIIMILIGLAIAQWGWAHAPFEIVLR